MPRAGVQVLLSVTFSVRYQLPLSVGSSFVIFHAVNSVFFLQSCPPTVVQLSPVVQRKCVCPVGVVGWVVPPLFSASTSLSLS